MSNRRLALVVPMILVALVGAALYSSVPASAFSTHQYLSQLTGFQDPEGIAFDSSSNVYVADAGALTVDRFDPSGAPLPFSASEPYVQGATLTGTPNGPFVYPHGVAVDDATGQIYVIDADVVDIFSASGEYLSQLTGVPAGAPASGSFTDGPEGLAIDQATNDLYLTTGIEGQSGAQEFVVEFDSSGQYVSEIDLPTVFANPDPYGVSVNELSGDIYVGVYDTDGQFHSVAGVEVFSPVGTLLPPAWLGADTPTQTFGVEKPLLGTDQTNGHLYVTNANSQAVDEFINSVEEDYEGQLTGTPSGPFTDPQAVAVDPGNGDVYVADSTGVVDIFGPDDPAPAYVGKASFSDVGATIAAFSVPVSAGEASARYHFEYGTTAAYGSRTVTTSAIDSFAASTEVSGLAPNTEYHFRLVVENEAGTAVSVDATFTTLPPSSIIEGLPDGRVFEMVTPVDKEDVEVYVPQMVEGAEQAQGYTTNRLSEAASNGDAVVYQGDPTHNGGGSSDGNGLGSAYLATRDQDGGWTQTGIQPPGRFSTEYRGFSSDLSVGVLASITEKPEFSEYQLPGGEAPSGQYGPNGFEERLDLYRHSLNEEDYQPLFSSIPYRAPSEFSSNVHDSGQADLRAPLYAGGTANLGQILFQANDDALPKGEGSLEKELTEDVKGEISNEETEFDYLYDWSGGEPSLVDVLPNGKVATDAMFGSPHLLNEYSESNPPDLSHVISSDGSRVFWSTLSGRDNHQRPTALYVRENPTQSQSPLNAQEECTNPSDACTIQLDKEIPGTTGGRFWTASSDGSKVFFTDGGLYEYEVNPVVGKAGVLTDLTPSVEVEGVIGASDDGEYVYYVDSADELYMLHEGAGGWEAPVSIATLSSTDGTMIEPFVGLMQTTEGKAGDWVADLGQRTAEVTPDGQGLVFMSTQSLKVVGFPNGYENDGQNEVYLYNVADNSLFCASCSQSGEPGSSGILPISWSDSYIATLASEGGHRVFFDSPSALVQQDTNGQMDVYEWEQEGTGSCARGYASRGGCIYLLTGGSNSEPSWLLGASSSGNDVFVITRANLTADAEDEVFKLFDARVEGVKPVQPTVCTGTGCQGVPAAPPTFTTPSSVTYDGVGNFPAPAAVAPTVKSKPNTLTRAQKLAKALKACKGKSKAKRKSCEAQARRRYGPIKKKAKKSSKAGVGSPVSSGGSK